MNNKNMWWICCLLMTSLAMGCVQGHEACATQPPNDAGGIEAGQDAAEDVGVTTLEVLPAPDEPATLTIHTMTMREGVPVRTFTVRAVDGPPVRATGVMVGWNVSTACVDQVGIEWGEGSDPVILPNPRDQPFARIPLAQPVRMITARPTRVRLLIWFQVPIPGSGCDPETQLQFNLGVNSDGNYKVKAEDPQTFQPTPVRGGQNPGPLVTITR